ncbi:MAG: thiamine pyrophosphate-dependent enzyme, partial [Gammaproteobacteria bacterium]
HVDGALARADAHMRAERRPFALIMRKGSVAGHPLRAVPGETVTAVGPASHPTPTASRADMLQAVQAAAAPGDVLVATTGYTGRELCALEDRANQFYMVGSMGCAPSLGLGMAIARPERRIVVLDGDGAALMRLGAMTTLGHRRPDNLVHVLFDNGMHESTGGQTTASASTDFPGMAAACGYPRVVVAATPDALARALQDADRRLSFVYAPTVPGVAAGLPRPKIAPPEIAARLRACLAGGR